MATKPTATGSRETLYAILGSFVVAVVLATIFTGNPFRSLIHAYKDYSREPYNGTPIASDTHAPANNGATQAK